MLPADMDALTQVWANPPIVRDHVLIVEADSGEGFTQVFTGTILQAQPDYSSAPNVCFQLQAITGYFQKINPAPPTSYPGQTDITFVVEELAARMSTPDRQIAVTVESNVDAVLSSPYLSGTLYDQLQQVCQAANVDFYWQGDTILITRANLGRQEQPRLILSPSSGLIGYPSYERAGLNVRCLYNQAILCGSPVEIRDSVVPGANGVWYPYSSAHTLECNFPQGGWFSELYCLRVIGETTPP